MNFSTVKIFVWRIMMNNLDIHQNLLASKSGIENFMKIKNLNLKMMNSTFQEIHTELKRNLLEIFN